MNKELLNKAKVNYFINELPLEIQGIIFSFAPQSDTAKIIKKVIDIYEKDHLVRYVSSVNFSVKSYLSFKNYVYHSSNFPTMYNFGPLIYNNGQNVVCKNAYICDRDNDYYYIHMTDYLRDNVK